MTDGPQQAAHHMSAHDAECAPTAQQRFHSHIQSYSPRCSGCGTRMVALKRADRYHTIRPRIFRFSQQKFKLSDLRASHQLSASKPQRYLYNET